MTINLVIIFQIRVANQKDFLNLYILKELSKNLLGLSSFKLYTFPHLYV